MSNKIKFVIIFAVIAAVVDYVLTTYFHMENGIGLTLMVAVIVFLGGMIGTFLDNKR